MYFIPQFNLCKQVSRRRNIYFIHIFMLRKNEKKIKQKSYIYLISISGIETEHHQEQRGELYNVHKMRKHMTI